MSKTLTLVWYFYKPLFALGLFFSLFNIYLVYRFGSKFIPFAIAIKIIGYLGYIFYKHHFANRTYLYFLNAGYSIKKLYIYSIGFDFILFITLLTGLVFTK